MKKFVVLTMILAMASLATAGLTLGVGGQDAVDSEIILAPSDIIMLDIIGSAGQLGTGTFVSIIGPGSLMGGYNEVNPVPGIILLGADLAQVDLLIPGNPPNTLDGVVAGLEFHCDGPGEVQIMLGLAPMDGFFDTLIIHQIPEPMTLGLLSLGGLFLRRKK